MFNKLQNFKDQGYILVSKLKRDDAIKTLKVDPVGYYFAPRILASAITVPMVVLIAEFIGILSGMVV